MLTEDQTSLMILFWLLQWKKSGAPPPHEAVCDNSKALLIGLINAFTHCKTISEYADACKSDKLPECYVRIDVAHTIKIFSDFLAKETKGVRNLYLGAIGLLIIATSFDEAEIILSDILRVCRSTYQGQLTDNILTKCTIAKNNLKGMLIKDVGTTLLITGNDIVDESLRNVTSKVEGTKI